MNYTKKFAFSSIYIKTLIFIMLIFCLMIGCNRAKTGKLVGVQASVNADDLFKGKIEKMDFAGIVIVELKDGTRVEAICDKEMWSKLRGGQMLKIAPVDSDVWKVIEIVKTKEEEKQ